MDSFIKTEIYQTETSNGNVEAIRYQQFYPVDD